MIDSEFTRMCFSWMIKRRVSNDWNRSIFWWTLRTGIALPQATWHFRVSLWEITQLLARTLKGTDNGLNFLFSSLELPSSHKFAMAFYFRRIARINITVDLFVKNFDKNLAATVIGKGRQNYRTEDVNQSILIDQRSSESIFGISSQKKI